MGLSEHCRPLPRARGARDGDELQQCTMEEWPQPMEISEYELNLIQTAFAQILFNCQREAVGERGILKSEVYAKSGLECLEIVKRRSLGDKNMQTETFTVEHTHDVLRDLIDQVTCKPDWSFRWLPAFRGEGPRMEILVLGPDSSLPHPQPTIGIRHSFLAPIATYSREAWRRWIFERCREVETHELGEWFKIDGERPFPPLHGPGENPYEVHEFRPEVDARTLQRGRVVERVS